jgi:hypothetical protein
VASHADCDTHSHSGVCVCVPPHGRHAAVGNQQWVHMRMHARVHAGLSCPWRHNKHGSLCAHQTSHSIFQKTTVTDAQCGQATTPRPKRRNTPPPHHHHPNTGTCMHCRTRTASALAARTASSRRPCSVDTWCRMRRAVCSPPTTTILSRSSPKKPWRRSSFRSSAVSASASTVVTSPSRGGLVPLATRTLGATGENPRGEWTAMVKGIGAAVLSAGRGDGWLGVGRGQKVWAGYRGTRGLPPLTHPRCMLSIPCIEVAG